MKRNVEVEALNIENDVLQAELRGQGEKEKFINERFQNVSSNGKLKYRN